MKVPSGVWIAVAAALCLLAACDHSKAKITGKWRTANDPNGMTWEFLEDGTSLRGSTRGRYTLGAQNRLKIQTPSATAVFGAEFVDDRMILKDISGTRIELVRVK